MGKSTQRASLVSIDGLPDYYATFTGGETTAEAGKVWDGGKKKADLLAGPPDTSNLICGRAYDPERDKPLIARLRKLAGSWYTTVTVQDTDNDFTPIGEPDTYPESLLVRVTVPEVDASSSEAKRYELEFATSGAA